MHDKLKKPWKFEVRYTTDFPRRVGRGQSGDPIYAPISEKGWAACMKYYEEVECFLAGKREDLPSLDLVAEALPHSSIVTFTVEDSNYDVFGPKVLVTIKDEDRRPEKRRPRLFDPVYFPPLLMLTAPGGSLRFNDSKATKDSNGQPIPRDDRRLFLSFGRGADQNIRVLRIIADAAPGEQVHRRLSKLDRNFHYDHRKSALEAKRDDTVRKGRQSAGASRKGRQAAIRVAGQHYEKARKQRGPEAVQHIAKSRAEFEQTLKRVLSLADACHKELVKKRRGE